LQLLKLFPEMYQVETEGRWEGLRRMPVGFHRLYDAYRHGNHTLYIDALVTYTE